MDEESDNSSISSVDRYSNRRVEMVDEQILKTKHKEMDVEESPCDSTTEHSTFMYLEIRRALGRVRKGSRLED